DQRIVHTPGRDRKWCGVGEVQCWLPVVAGGGTRTELPVVTATAGANVGVQTSGVLARCWRQRRKPSPSSRQTDLVPFVAMTSAGTGSSQADQARTVCCRSSGGAGVGRPAKRRPTVLRR